MEERKDFGIKNSASSPMTTKILLILGGLIILGIVVFLINKSIGKSLPKDQNISQADDERHKNASAAEIDAALDKFEHTGAMPGSSNYSPEQQAALAAKITTRYEERLNTAAKAVAEQASGQALGKGISVFFTETERPFNQKALDTYMTFASNALTAFSTVDAECVRSLAAVAASTNSALASAQQCHTYEYTPKINELKKVTSTRKETTNVKNRGGAALFGLFRSKRADKEITTEDYKTASHERTVDYIPHCKGSSIDPATMEVMLGAQLNATISILTMSAAAWSRYPNAKDFI